MRSPRRVLLVDDEVDLREMCTEYLTTAGYEVLQAANGAEAIDIAIARRPDVIVMDIEMPVMDGLEAAQRLAADARTYAIPVIMLSAYRVAELLEGESSSVARSAWSSHATPTTSKASSGRWWRRAGRQRRAAVTASARARLPPQRIVKSSTVYADPPDSLVENVTVVAVAV